MRTKIITIGITGANGKSIKNIRILPDTTVEDIIKDLNLSGYLLQKTDGSAYALADKPFESVVDGGKVFATPGDVEAG